MIRIMRPVMHPSIDDITLDAVFHALSDRNRLRIVANLYHQQEQPLICTEAVKGIDNLPASTTSNHFRILRECGLVRSVREGRDCFNTLRLDELEVKFPGLFTAVLNSIQMMDETA